MKLAKPLISNIWEHCLKLSLIFDSLPQTAGRKDTRHTKKAGEGWHHSLPLSLSSPSPLWREVSTGEHLVWPRGRWQDILGCLCLEKGQAQRGTLSLALPAVLYLKAQYTHSACYYPPRFLLGTDFTTCHLLSTHALLWTERGKQSHTWSLLPQAFSHS